MIDTLPQFHIRQCSEQGTSRPVYELYIRLPIARAVVEQIKAAANHGFMSAVQDANRAYEQAQAHTSETRSTHTDPLTTIEAPFSTPSVE